MPAAAGPRTCHAFDEADTALKHMRGKKERTAQFGRHVTIERIWFVSYETIDMVVSGDPTRALV